MTPIKKGLALDEEAVGHLVKQYRLVHAIPACGHEAVLLEDVNQLHPVGEVVDVVDGH